MLLPLARYSSTSLAIAGVSGESTNRFVKIGLVTAPVYEILPPPRAEVVVVEVDNQSLALCVLIKRDRR